VTQLRSPEAEFQELAARSTDEFARPYLSLLRAVIGKDTSAIRRARERCAQVLGQTMVLADLSGRRRVVLEFRHYDKGEQFAMTPVVPNVPFKDAIADMLSRTPELATTADVISELYNTRHVFAMVQSSELSLTEAVRNFIGKALKRREPAPSALSQLQGVSGFARGYANSVYRTNLTTAYTAGRFQQAQEPGVRDVLPAMERWEVMDSATRRGRKEDGGENHAAVHGLIMATRDPRWARYAPPSGYGCRGGVRMVPVPELRRRHLWKEATREVIPHYPPGLEKFTPHERFGQRRPGLLIYGAL